MATRWHIQRTRELVASKHGEAQVRLMRNCLRSVTERLRHARYHFQEARDLLKVHIDDRLSETSIYLLTWPTEPDERNAFENCLMQVEANLIACAQAIHSIADNLAHVAYFGLGMNLGTHSLRERDVTALRVASVIELHVPTALSVAQLLRTLLSDPAFIAIDAFANTTKHRGFAETRINIDPQGNGSSYVYEFGAFDYRDVLHPERDIAEVLMPGYAAASKAVVGVGEQLNAVLAA